MPSFPPCREHGIRACPCAHPDVQYSGDIAKIDEAIVQAQAFVDELVRFKAQVASRPRQAKQRRLTRYEKARMANFPSWAVDAPVTVDASIPIGSITDFNDI